jgi:dTDP-4-amino-4,6-dideoxygalactose transaminase
LLRFGAPALEESEIADVVTRLRSGWIGVGPEVERFEAAFARYKDVPFAVSMNSCSAAMHVALLALGIGPGDEVITTPMTFVSTVNAIIHTGAMPVLADCDPKTMNLLPEAVESKLSPRTRALLPVHFAGRCCDMESLLAIARAHDLHVVEDCAHSLESEHPLGRAGDLGSIGCFSFYVSKNVTTAMGGMAITRDPGLEEQLRLRTFHGMDRNAWKRFSHPRHRHYDVVLPGFEYSMTDLHASIGLRQLERIERNWERRRRLWAIFDEELDALPCVLPAPPEPGTRHAYHLYTPLLELERLSVSRDEVLDAMRAENIGTGVHYWPVHQHQYYRETYGWRIGEYPNAEHVGDRTLSLPLAANLTEDDARDVCRALTRILNHYATA